MSSKPPTVMKNQCRMQVVGVRGIRSGWSMQHLKYAQVIKHKQQGRLVAIEKRIPGNRRGDCGDHPCKSKEGKRLIRVMWKAAMAIIVKTINA